MPARYQCPACRVMLTLVSPPEPRFECPRCAKVVTLAPVGAAPAPVRTAPPAPVSAPKPARVPPAPAADSPRGSADRRIRMGVIVAGSVLVLAAAVVVAAVALRKPAEPTPELARVEQPPEPAPAAAQPPPAKPAEVVAPPKKPDPQQPAPPPIQHPLTQQPAGQGDQLAVAPPPRVRQFGRTLLMPVPVAQAETRPLRLGVNPKGSDDVGAILTSLGKGYAYTDLAPEDLATADRLGKYDVVFLNCGGPVWGDRAAEVIRGFVAAGGTLYASDLQYDLVRRAFPKAAGANPPNGLGPGTYKADVLHDGLVKHLGRAVDLEFDLGGWATAGFAGPDVSVILAAAEGGRGLRKGAPLLVKFPHGKGTVVFTSFHNSAIAGDTARTLLRYLVFSTVVADAESRVLAALNRDRFAVRSSDLLAATEDGWSVTRKYALAAEGTFRVAAGFNNDRAEMRLTLTGPAGTGVVFERESAEPFIVEVVNAPPGEWTLTLAAKRVPHPNFPVALFVAEPKGP